MTGTKHEKIVLVLLAYIIGLTSGSIAFAFNNFNSSSNSHSVEAPVSEETNLDTPITTLSEEAQNPTNDYPNDSTSLDEIVSYVDGRLYALAGGEEYLLSIDKDLVGEQVPEALKLQGIHTTKPPYTTSPTGDYIFFCEAHSDTNDCVGLIYDVNNNLIQYLSLTGEKLVVNIDEANQATWTDTGLDIGNYQSESLEAPWKLVAK